MNVPVPEASTTVAPSSLYVPPNSQVRKAAPLRVMDVGAVVSTTVTTLVVVPALPEASVAV